jgi:predicted acetyltransferase
VDDKTLSVRRIGPGEEEAFERSVRVPFLDPYTDDPDSQEDLRQGLSMLEADRAWVVDDGSRFVGQCGVYSLDVSLPPPPGSECPVLPMAGITAVGVHPTHRRKGLLRRMMSEMIADARSRGEAIAGLIASESAIYGRYGFGHATDRIELFIETAHAGFSIPAPEVDISLVDPKSSGELLAGIYRRQRLSRPGEIGRSPQAWDWILSDNPGRRGAGRGMFVAVCDGGYVRYRNQPGRMFDAEGGRVVVEELRADTPEIEAALWRFVLDLDLVDEVTALRRPVDEPLRWRLTDPRRLRLKRSEDMLHLKILDVAAAFEARGYQTSGAMVIEVVPPPGGGDDDPAHGAWFLDAGPDGAVCRKARAGEAPDLVVDSAALGSLFLGGFFASVLAAGGRVRERSAGKILAADLVLSSRPAPLTTTGF